MIWPLSDQSCGSFSTRRNAGWDSPLNSTAGRACDRNGETWGAPDAAGGDGSAVGSDIDRTGKASPAPRKASAQCNGRPAGAGAVASVREGEGRRRDSVMRRNEVDCTRPRPVAGPAEPRTYNPRMSASHDDAGQPGPSGAAAPSAASRLVAAGRHFDRPIATVNLPVTRASSVLFDTLAQADAEGAASMAGEVHRTTYATSGTPTTMALMDALAEVEGAPHRCRAALIWSRWCASPTIMAMTRSRSCWLQFSPRWSRAEPS